MYQAYLLPRTLGIHGTQKGYYYLVDSIQMALEDEKNLILFTQTMFPIIAQKYDTTAANVDHNLRALIEQCWNSPFKEELLKLAPYRLVKKPTVGEFIDILYWNVKLMDE